MLTIGCASSCIFSSFSSFSLSEKDNVVSSSSVGKNMSRGSISRAIAMRYIDAVVSDLLRKNCAIDCELMPQASANAFVPNPIFCMSLRRLTSDFGLFSVSIIKQLYIFIYYLFTKVIFLFNNTKVLVINLSVFGRKMRFLLIFCVLRKYLGVKRYI